MRKVIAAGTPRAQLFFPAVRIEAPTAPSRNNWGWEKGRTLRSVRTWELRAPTATAARPPPGGGPLVHALHDGDKEESHAPLEITS